MRLCRSACAVLLLLAPLHAQQDPPPALTAVQDPAQRAGLIALAKELDETRKELAQARENAANDPDRRQAVQRVRDLEARIQESQRRFNSLTVGVDPAELEAARVDAAGDLQSEVTRLLQPIVQKLRDATAEPREMESLRSRIATIESDRLPGAQLAKERARAELAAVPAAMAGADPAETELLEAQLQRVVQSWTDTERRFEQQRTILRAELRRHESTRTSFWSAATTMMQDFVRTRGLNLALAVAAFLGVFFGLRFVQRRVTQARKARKERRFGMRLLGVLLHALVILGSIGALMLTLYLVGDWLLLALAMIFLIGAGWAVVKVMPRYLEQVRIVLNLGSVREGERILWDGLPWRVEALRFQTILINPLLQGGMLRIPLADLVGKRSRPMSGEEPYFPCKKGDWVHLNDGTRGQVQVQTPDVVVVQTSGSEKSYPTLAFLAQAPRNLSTGFLIEVTFGIDLEHIEAVEEMPRVFERELQQKLPLAVDAGVLKKITVVFLQASGASLDLLAAVTVDGSGAAVSAEIQRAMHHIILSTCTDNGWSMSVPPVVVQPPKVSK